MCVDSLTVLLFALAAGLGPDGAHNKWTLDLADPNVQKTRVRKLNKDGTFSGELAPGSRL